MGMSRREFLAAAGAAGLLAPLSACASKTAGSATDGAPIAAVAVPAGGQSVPEQVGLQIASTAPLPPRFARPLPIPVVLAPSGRDGDTDVYDLTAKASYAQILPGLRTEIWGYAGTFPGPTIVSRAGRRVRVNLRNALPVPIVSHLHGGHTPPESDGYPTDFLLPRGTWRGALPGPGRVEKVRRQHDYPLAQRAATLWYHDHRMDFTGPQVYKGLLGMHLHRDAEEESLPLPNGAREIPLIVADRAFRADGALLYPANDPTLVHTAGVTGSFDLGVLGDVILVNGAPWPYLAVDRARYRFRLLNACNARHLRLTLDPAPADGPPFVQVGGDGGLLAAPINQSVLPVAPAERFDLIVDFAAYPAGTKIRLVNEWGTGPTENILEFRVGADTTDRSSIPATLSTVEVLDEAKAVRTRVFSFARDQTSGMGEWSVAQHAFSPTKIAAAPKLGEVEVWEFTTDSRHPIHTHLSPFQIIARNGTPTLRAGDHGWKDIVSLQPGETAKILVRYADYRGKYVMHCHNLEHEDMAMMANFETL